MESEENEIWLMVVHPGVVARAWAPPHDDRTCLSKRPFPELLRMEMRGGSLVEISAMASHCLSWLEAMAVILLTEGRGSEMWLVWDEFTEQVETQCPLT